MSSHSPMPGEESDPIPGLRVPERDLRMPYGPRMPYLPTPKVNDGVLSIPQIPNEKSVPDASLSEVQGTVRGDVEALTQPLKKEEIEQCLLHEFRFARLFPERDGGKLSFVIRDMLDAAEAAIPTLMEALPPVIDSWTQISHLLPSLLDAMLAALPQDDSLTKIFKEDRDNMDDVMRLKFLHDALNNIVLFIGKRFQVWIDRNALTKKFEYNRHLHSLPLEVQIAVRKFGGNSDKKHKVHADRLRDTDALRVTRQMLVESLAPLQVDRTLVDWMNQRRQQSEGKFFEVLGEIPFEKKRRILTSITAQREGGYEIYLQALNTPSLPVGDYRERVLVEQKQGATETSERTGVVPGEHKNDGEQRQNEEVVSGPSMTKKEFILLGDAARENFFRGVTRDPAAVDAGQFYIMNLLSTVMADCPAVIDRRSYEKLFDLIIMNIQIADFFEGTTLSHSQRQFILNDPDFQASSKLGRPDTGQSAQFLVRLIRMESAALVEAVREKLQIPTIESGELVKFFAKSPLYLGDVPPATSQDGPNYALFSGFVQNVLDHLPARLDAVMARKVFDVIDRAHQAYFDAIPNLVAKDREHLKQSWLNKMKSDELQLGVLLNTANYQPFAETTEIQELDPEPDSFFEEDDLMQAAESEPLPEGFIGDQDVSCDALRRMIDVIRIDFLQGDIKLQPLLTKAERESLLQPMMKRFTEIAMTVVDNLGLTGPYSVANVYKAMIVVVRKGSPFFDLPCRRGQLPQRLLEILTDRFRTLEKQSQPTKGVVSSEAPKKFDIVVAPKVSDVPVDSGTDVIVSNPMQEALDLVLSSEQSTPEMIERVLTEAVITCFDRQMAAFEASVSNGGAKRAGASLHAALRTAMTGLCDDGIPDLAVVKNQVLRVRGLLDLSSTGLSPFDRELFFKIVVQAAIAHIDEMHDPLELLDAVIDMDLSEVSSVSAEVVHEVSMPEKPVVAETAHRSEPLTKKGLMDQINQSARVLHPLFDRMRTRFSANLDRINKVEREIKEIADTSVDQILKLKKPEDLRRLCHKTATLIGGALRSRDQLSGMQQDITAERKRIGAWIRERLGLTPDEDGEEEDASSVRISGKADASEADVSGFTRLLQSWFGVDTPAEAKKALARGVTADLSRNMHALLELLPKRDPSVAASVASRLLVAFKVFLNAIENEMVVHANPDHIAVAEMLERQVSTLIANLSGQVTEVDLSMIAEAMEDEVYRFAEMETDDEFLLHSGSVGTHLFPDARTIALLLSESRAAPVALEPDGSSLSSLVTSLPASGVENDHADAADRVSAADDSEQVHDMSGVAPSHIESREIAPEIKREHSAMKDLWSTEHAFHSRIDKPAAWLVAAVLRNIKPPMENEHVFRQTVYECVRQKGNVFPTLEEYAAIRSRYTGHREQTPQSTPAAMKREFVTAAEAAEGDSRLLDEYITFRELHAIVRRDRSKNIGWFIVSLAKNVYGAMSSVPARSEFSALMEESFGMVIPYSFEGYCRRRGMPPMEKAEPVSEEPKVVTAPETTSETASVTTDTTEDLPQDDVAESPVVSVSDDIHPNVIDSEDADLAEGISPHTPATTAPVVIDVSLPSSAPSVAAESVSDGTLQALRTETAKRLPQEFGEVPVEATVLAERLAIGMKMHRALSDALAGEEKNMNDLLPQARQLAADALALENELQQFLQEEFGNCMAQLEGGEFERVVQDCVLDVALSGTVSMKEVDRNALADRIRQEGLEPIERMRALLKRFRQYEERVEEMSVRSQTLLASVRSGFGVSEQMSRPYFGITASTLFASDVTSFGVTVDEMRRLLLVDIKRIQYAMDESIHRADIERINKIFENEQSLVKALRKLVPEQQRAENVSVDRATAGDIDASSDRRTYSPEEAAERLSGLSPLQIDALRILTGLPEKRETTHGYAIKRLQKYWKVVFPDLAVPQEEDFARAFAVVQDAPGEGNPLVADCRELNGQDLRSIPGRKNAANILRRQGDSLLKVWQPYPWKPVDFYLPCLETYDLLASADRSLDDKQIEALREIVNQDSENLKQILVRKKKKKDALKKKI